MTVLRYIVPPEADCQRLEIFLRTQGVTAALIKSVKYNGDGFSPMEPRSTPISLCIPASRSALHCRRNCPPASRRSPSPFAIAYEDEFAAVLESPPVSLYIPR